MTNTKYIHRSVKPHPMAELDDGCLDFTVQAGKARCRALKYMLCFEKGDSMFDDAGNLKTRLGINYFKLSAWRFQPDTAFLTDRRGNAREQSHGWIDIDGEKFPLRTCQSKVLHKALPILLMRRSDEE